MKKYAPRRADYHDPQREVLRPIVGLDIDGTLGEYHEHFWQFAQAWVGRPLPHPAAFRGGSFAAFLGLSKATYRKIKLAYRRGGLKRSMPLRDGAGSLAKSLRDRGAIVALCTTRPYLSLENVDEDTRHWAKRNKISHDFIIWGEHKYRELARFGRGRVIGILDDEPLLVAQARQSGLNGIIIDRQYNRGTEDKRLFELHEAETAFNFLLDEWEEANR